MPEQNPYACLGLLPGSSSADIKRRYRQLAKQYHPDAQGKASSEDKLRVLNAAYEILSDPAKKAAYDTAYEARFAVFNPARAPLPARPPRRRELPLRAVFGLSLVFLLSAGIGVLCSQQNVGPALSSFYARLSGKAAGPDRPPPSYTFLPSRGAFDDPNAGAPASPPAPAGLP